MSEDTTQGKGAETGTAPEQEQAEKPTQGQAEKVFTQADVDKIARKAKRDYDDLSAELQKYKDANKSELELAIERATAAEAKLADFQKAAELAEWKQEARKEVGLSEDFDKYLIGSSLAEIKASAKELADKLPKGSQRHVVFSDTGNVQTPPGKSDFYEELKRQMGG